MTLDELRAAEPFASGYNEYSERDIFERISHAYATYLAAIPPAAPNSDFPDFYPAGRLTDRSYCVTPSYHHAYDVRRSGNAELDACLEPLFDDYLRFHLGGYPHNVAGWCWTHSLPNYGRIAREGFDSYRERILAGGGDDAFKRGLCDLLDGIRAYREHALELLRESNASPALIAALEKVPFKPAESVYEALVAWNFVYHLDGCDNVGRLDEDLLPFYRGEDSTSLLREFFTIVDRTNGYSASVGPDYNPLTFQCLRAVKGLRRPQIELRVTPEMPDEIWDAALDSLAEGGTNPSLYNENGFREAFRIAFPELPDADFKRFCGVGCTEASLAGMTFAGSLDAGMNLVHILSRVLREKLAGCKSFDEFYAEFFKVYRAELAETLDKVYKIYEIRAKCRPLPMRTLTIDDCIDSGRDFNAGGARYNWSVINFAGIVNLIEAMLAARELVFGGMYTAEELVASLDSGDATLLAEIRRLTHFGVNDESVDDFAKKLTSELFAELEGYRSYHGGRVIASSIQFNCCASAGRDIPATPDGRECGASLADSIAAIHGYDTDGITSMLSSSAAIDQAHMPGTPVLNLRLEKSFLRENLRAVTLGYFAKGGLQLQISCLSREDMEDALEHPERHGNLVVRVGGYSEYFVRLPRELQLQILSRREFS